MENHKGINAVKAKNRNDWRKWLMKNHLKEERVWLVLHHKSNPIKSINYVEAVEEALCFGWIDSRPNKRDDKSYYQLFSRRNPKSLWSESNRIRVARLKKENKIMPAGQAMIALAKKKGTWNHRIETGNDSVPDDLKKEFARNKSALKKYHLFPPSSKRIILEWINSAKRPETREKRIKETVKLAKLNIRANHYSKK